MRNLVVGQELRARLDGGGKEDGARVLRRSSDSSEHSDHVDNRNDKSGDEVLDEEDEMDRVATDPYLGTLFILSKRKRLFIYSPTMHEVSYQASLSHVIPEDSEMVGCQFVPDLGVVCFATAAGDIVTFNVESQTAECVGFVDAAVQCMSWSPNYEALLLVTGNNSLVAMTQDWEILNEVPIDDDHDEKQGDASTSTVDGDKGKAVVEEGDATEKSHGSRPAISWRGDGQYFVLNTVNSSGRRQLRVYDRLLNFDSVAVDTHGLESPLSWRPSGSSIASTERKPNKHDVIFYERNGLRLDRMDFTIRDDAEVISINWNASSDILAVTLDIPSQKTTVVELWTMENYHWYLKQQFRYPQVRVADVLWDPENQMTLNVLLSDGHIIQYRLYWDVCVSDGSSDRNPSLAAVIDGRSLHLTPFSKLVVPPPMWAAKLDLDQPSNPDSSAWNISGVAFAPNSYDIALLLSDRSIAFFSTPPYASGPPFDAVPSKIGHLSIMGHPKVPIARDSGVRHLVRIADDVVILVESAVDLKVRDYLVELQVVLRPSSEKAKSEGEDKNGKREVEVVRAERTAVEGRVLRVYHNKDTGSTFVELDDGTVFSYRAGPEPKLERRFQFQGAGGQRTACPWIASARMEQDEVLIGLNERAKLFMNELLISSECNSFALHQKFLCYTTLTHTLRFLPLGVSLQAIRAIIAADSSASTSGSIGTDKQAPAASAQGQPTYDDRVRDIERGGRLVCVVPRDTRTVLQMPRGNLETINPRMLILSHIRDLLDRHAYETAFALMRRHRIDLNLIYDHDPKEFLARVDDFVSQIRRVDYINLFLSSLAEVDVTKTLFASIYGRTPGGDILSAPVQTRPGVEEQSKVNVVADAIRASLEKIDARGYLLSILTALVVRDPPALEQALLLIRNLRDTQPAEVLDPFGLEEQKPSAPQGPTAEEALKYAVFLVDVDELYDVALGMYDFDLVMMVAQKSQKESKMKVQDPKEYLPFLQELQDLPTYVQRYTIDSHLGRHARSLENLSKADDSHFPQCLEVMRKHQLYQEAIRIFKHSDSKLREVLRVYAGAHDQIANGTTKPLLRIGDLERAASSFQRAGSWQLLFATLDEIGRSPEEIQEVAHEIAETLQNLGRNKDAGAVLDLYARDPEQAVVSLLDGGHFTEAIRVSFAHKRGDLIETNVRPAALEHQERHLSKFRKRHRRFLRYKERLPVARELATARAIEEEAMEGREGGEEEEGLETSSEISDAPSGVGSVRSSVSSRSVTGSSTYESVMTEGGTRRRVRKPPSRKRVTGKEGSPYEEEWLVGTMKQLIPTSKFLGDIKELLEALVMFGNLEEAGELQRALSAFVSLVESAADLLEEGNCVFLQLQQKKKQRQQMIARQLGARGIGSSSIGTSGGGAGQDEGTSSKTEKKMGEAKRLVPACADVFLSLFE